MTQPIAKHAPAPRPLRTVEDIFAELNTQLKTEYCLDPFPGYTVVVEGWTDVYYLRLAAELARKSTGHDLLAVPSHQTDSLQSSHINIVTPGQRGDPSRGGVKQIARLARDIRTACFTFNAYSGIAFVLDHDNAGQECSQSLQEYGFKPNKYSLTLDPKQHPTACGDKQVVIEDLLSLAIQKSFFDQGTSWCQAIYESGQLRRFDWA